MSLLNMAREALGLLREVRDLLQELVDQGKPAEDTPRRQGTPSSVYPLRKEPK